MSEKKRILVVDDDPDILTLEQRVLTREGFEVVTVDNGKQAIELLSREKFDLVLLDVMMPEVDGFEVSRAFTESGENRRVPVVFVTARDDAGAMREGFSAGGTVFLSKPFTAAQLVRLVHTLIGG
ncbi:MAG: response regulator [Deltaproteobacteria bacterium]|nr:MAG: response regulator [Deltaproteobacteria bacterium]